MKHKRGKSTNLFQSSEIKIVLNLLDKTGAGSVCHSRESGSKTRLGENPNISFLLHNGCPLSWA
jgi:hypothetical protein